MCLKHKHVKKLKVKGQKKTDHANFIQNKAGISILILDEVEFKQKIIRDRVI